VVLVLLVGGGFWYFTLGRKPKLLISASIAQKTGTPSAHAIAPGEVLLFRGSKVTLYDTAAGREKWTSDLGPALTTDVPTQARQSSEISTGEISQDKNDPMRQIMEARIDRRSAKLGQMAAQLSARRDKLDTALKQENFKVDESKYQAELDDL